MKRCLVLVVALLGLAVAAAEARAAIGFRQLTGTYPAAVQRGTKSTVTVYSNFTLDGAYEVLFDEPGVRMTLAEPKPLGGGHNGKSRAGNPFRFEVEVPAEQASRIYEYRIATPQGVSSLGLLRVTDYPVIVEPKGENGTAATAQPVTLPATLCGKSEREDVDCYRIEGAAGEELICEVFGQRILVGIHDMIATNADYTMDPLLTLYGPNGQIVAQNDNTFGGDSLLACKLPTTGSYVLEVRDARYVGHAKYTYCVEVAKRPYALALFPFAVQRGQTAAAELIGPFCESAAKVPLSAAADEGVGRKYLRPETPRGVLNPLSVLVSEHPQLLATGDNTSLAKPMPLTLPVGVSGRLNGEEDAHHYAFEAHKGAWYVFEVHSQRFDLPLDGVIEVLDAAGKLVEGAVADDTLLYGDEMAYHKDPRLFFKAPADGRFIVQVRDMHGRGGPAFAYHLRAEPTGGEFELKTECYYAMLAHGTRTLWFARVARFAGFEGPVKVSMTGLPPGVSCQEVTIPAGINDCSLNMIATAEAPVGAALVHVVGQAEVTGPDGKPQTIERVARATCEQQGTGGGQYLWPCRTQIVGVVEKLDVLQVEASPTEVTLTPGGKVEIEVRVERDKDYTDMVNLDMTFMYPGAPEAARRGMQLPPGVTLGKGSQLRLVGKEPILRGKIVLEASDKAAPIEQFPISVLAGVNISFSVNTIYASNPIALTVAKKETVAAVPTSPAGGNKPAVGEVAAPKP